MKSLKNLLLGNALANDALKHEKLSRIWGLPIMASDAVSSVAYAVEEILLALIMGTVSLGMLAPQYVGLISIPIIVLLLMLIFSYSQIINHYPQGGGAYVVAKENFGHTPSLLAASCLVVDYILTVAVSISSSTAAIVSAFPALAPHKVLISLICISLITLINLRGASESSKIFGVPTYLFILMMVIFIITGFIRVMTGSLAPIETDAALIPPETVSGITLLLFLRAFSSGCSALTGVEAVSDAVPSFREPSAKTARHVLYMLGTVIIFIFGGTCFLASTLKVVPLHDAGVTVMSQMAAVVFGKGILFYFLQFTTALILLLAANTAYNGLPILLSVLSKDRYMPLQFAHRGAKLSFSNGILFIFIAGGLLLFAFDANTHALIPFYAVGVLVSFTISQFGMFIKWVREKEKGWRYKCIINGAGALVTFIGSIVVFAMKFLDGAWALLIVIPIIMCFMFYTHRHYVQFGKAVSTEGFDYQYKESKSRDKLPCIVLIHHMNKASLKTFDYAKDISSDITALHISTTPEHTEKLKKQWKEFKIGVPLTVIPAPYRDILNPLDQYISKREAKLAHGKNLTVVLTKFVGNGWQDKIFHNQTTFFIVNKLGKHKNVATVLVPYIYSVKNI